MLCKTTMRAALAHVLGIVGIAGAFGASAAADHPYAAESLSKGMTETVYAIKGSPMGKIVLDVGIDTLLENEDDYYMVVNFWDAELTTELATTFTIDTHADNDRTWRVPLQVATWVLRLPVATTQPMVGNGMGFRFYTVTESVRGNPTADPAVTASKWRNHDGYRRDPRARLQGRRDRFRGRLQDGDRRRYRDRHPHPLGSE